VIKFLLLHILIFSIGISIGFFAQINKPEIKNVAEDVEPQNDWPGRRTSGGGTRAK